MHIGKEEGKRETLAELPVFKSREECVCVWPEYKIMRRRLTGSEVGEVDNLMMGSV